MSSHPAPDFGGIASRYDELRPVDDNWWEIYELVVLLADLRGRRVLDIGCGTGRVSRALAERAAAKVWGIDPSPEMLAEARANVPRGVAFKEARAESLPFKDGWFERAVLWLVVHLLDRPTAFAEAKRVLAPGGRLAVVSFDESHFDAYWLNRFLPSLEEIDRARFPRADGLEREMRDAGFGEVTLVRRGQRASLSRDEALARMRAGHISTLRMLDPAELARGVAVAERELPPRVEYDLRWLLAVAS